MDLTVAVIAKECLPGRVKTRMAPPLSAAGAAELAQLSLTRTLDTVRRLPASSRLLVMEGTPRSQDAEGFTVVRQAAGRLDERLAAVCDFPDGPLLILGMDTPQFSPEHLAGLIRDWTAAPPTHEAWLGPAADGGFWAIALLRPRGSLIRGVPMSTDTTAARQLARLALHGLSTGTAANTAGHGFLHRCPGHRCRDSRYGFRLKSHRVFCTARDVTACGVGTAAGGTDGAVSAANLVWRMAVTGIIGLPAPVLTAAGVFGQGVSEPYARALRLGGGTLTLRDVSSWPRRPAWPGDFRRRVLVFGGRCAGAEPPAESSGPCS